MATRKKTPEEPDRFVVLVEPMRHRERAYPYDRRTIDMITSPGSRVLRSVAEAAGVAYREIDEADLSMETKITMPTSWPMAT